RAVHRALVEHEAEIDALNVFPVPDGDTGSNLAATAQAVVRAAGPNAPPEAIVRAAMRSARGNSGVIFSQVVRGVVEAVVDPQATGDVDVLARGLANADRFARLAVAEPVEGTILTAITAAADAAARSRDAGTVDLAVALEEVRVAVAQAVRATRDQLDVLRDAGVVDAGARGLEVVVTALVALVTGQAVTPDALDNILPRCVPGQDEHLAEFPVEVQFVLHGDDDDAGALRAALGALGDSVVVVSADGLIQAHVHTADVDAVLALAKAQCDGELQDIRVTDLRAAAAEDDDDVPPLAVVAVLPAGGLADLGRSAGASVVNGAAGSLPSVEDLLLAARRTGAKRVAVLPGHPNALPTARQARELSELDGGPMLDVVAHAAHPLVVLACLALQSDDAATLDDVAAGCRSGEIVAAVRDAQLPIGSVAAGQPLMLVDGHVIGAADTLSGALAALMSHLNAPSSELVTIAVGADADMDLGDVMMAAAVGAGEAEVDVLDGAQRPALLLVVVEG
ncbi:MAG: DAK2 domain fusion protein YloV, partial [Glaciecola sp.]